MPILKIKMENSPVQILENYSLLLCASFTLWITNKFLHKNLPDFFNENMLKICYTVHLFTCYEFDDTSELLNDSMLTGDRSCDFFSHSDTSLLSSVAS